MKKNITDKIPQIKLTATKIEELVTKRVIDATPKKLSPKTFLDIAQDSFPIDSPYVVPLVPLMRKPLVGEKRVSLNEAHDIIKFVKGKLSGALLEPDSKIVEILGFFGRENKNYVNLSNLENALIIYASENRNLKKKLFVDPLFTTLVRLYFAEYIGELVTVEHLLAFMGKRGAITARKINLMGKTYVKLVEWERWAKIYKKVTGDKLPDSKDSKEKKLRTMIESTYKSSIKSVAGSGGSLSRMLSKIERAAAAGFSDVEMVRAKQIALTKIGKHGKVWVAEGEEIINKVQAFLAQKKKVVLSDAEFIELCKQAGGAHFNTIGIQSALMQIMSEGITNKLSVARIIADVPEFSTLLRLYFGLLIMKLGVTELFMVVFGEDTLLGRIRGGGIGRDFNALVVEETYTDLVKQAKDTIKQVKSFKK